MASSPQRTQLGALALVVAGVVFVLYPALRPWQDESTVEGATAAMSSGAWVASHLFAMIGFILVPLGLLALWCLVAGRPVERLALIAAIGSWVGAGLTLPFYGAETFGLNGVAGRVAPGETLAVVDAIRFGPVAVTTFALGLLTLAVAAVLAAVTVWRSGLLPRYSGVLFGLGFALFIPQFYTPAAVRISHGVLVAAGCFWLAWAMWRGARQPGPE